MKTREQSATLTKAWPSLITAVSLFLVAMTAACIKIEVNTNSSASGGFVPPAPTPPPPGGGGGSGPIVTPPPHGDSVVFHTSDVITNIDKDDCFLNAYGWISYIQFPLKFEGPKSNHSPGVYPNDDDLTNLVVKTCNVLNPTNFTTGIVIVEVPSGNAECATSNCLVSPFHGRLATLSKKMTTNTLYEARIYFKTSNIPSLTVDWNYQ
jgi:hypothetical protein